MSRAFVKEDIDLPERSTQRRSSSGLPPGALNYMTDAGARRLRQRLAELKASAADEEKISDLENLLGSVTLVTPPARPEAAVIGVRVTLRSDTGEMKSLRIVGVDEVEQEPHQVTWVSPLGKALLGVSLGDRISLEAGVPRRWTVVKLE